MNATRHGRARPRTSASDRFRRLTSLDLMFLRFESPEWPCHFAGLAVVDGAALVDEAGRLRLDELTDRTSRRLANVPELRRRLHFPGVLRGGPLWVDDDRFDIRHHIHQAAVEAPGGDAELLELAARLDERQLDRTRPLWELWFLTGLRDGRIGVLLKLHHCVADGTGSRGADGIAVRRRTPRADPDPAPWTPEPIPGAWSLLIDNLARQGPNRPAGSRDAGSSATTRSGGRGHRRPRSADDRRARRPADVAESARPGWPPSPVPSSWTCRP